MALTLLREIQLVVCTIALQYHVPMETIRTALMRDMNGNAAGRWESCWTCWRTRGRSNEAEGYYRGSPVCCYRLAAIRVDMWPLEKIKPYAGNPRTHPPEQIAALAAAMREDGVYHADTGTRKAK